MKCLPRERQSYKNLLAKREAELRSTPAVPSRFTSFTELANYQRQQDRQAASKAELASLDCAMDYLTDLVLWERSGDTKKLDKLFDKTKRLARTALANLEVKKDDREKLQELQKRKRVNNVKCDHADDIKRFMDASNCEQNRYTENGLINCAEGYGTPVTATAPTYRKNCVKIGCGYSEQQRNFDILQARRWCWGAESPRELSDAVLADTLQRVIATPDNADNVPKARAINSFVRARHTSLTGGGSVFDYACGKTNSDPIDKVTLDVLDCAQFDIDWEEI